MASLNFLTIHPEIREIIYIMHLTTSDTLGPTPIVRANRLPRRSNDWPSTLDTRDRIGDTHFFFESCNRYPDPTINPAKPASLSLLLCCRQIFAEVSSVITFLSAHTRLLRYEIDCEVVNESDLYPTWLHIPVRFKDVPIPCVHATFRISGQLDRKVTRRSSWDHGCGGPGPMVWSLLALLNRFLKIGPNFVSFKVAAPAQVDVSTSDSSVPSGSSFRDELLADIIKVENLVIEFAPSSLTHEELDARLALAAPDRCRMEKIDPKDVAKLVKGELDYIFSGSKYTIEYGSFIASRVERVSLRCDGKDIGEWDLAETKVLHAH